MSVNLTEIVVHHVLPPNNCKFEAFHLCSFTNIENKNSIQIPCLHLFNPIGIIF